MKIRFVREEDCRALLDIYAQYIDTAITFEYELPSEEEFARRIRTISLEYPYLVCESEGKIVGYAYAHRQMERAAYQWNAELSVYISRDYVSGGIGTALYQELLRLLEKQGIRNVYSLITAPNEKSERLHESMGFRLIGVMTKTGYKNGKWWDVSWYEKQLAPYEDEPEELRRVGAHSMIENDD